MIDCCALPAGERNVLVEIQSQTATPDGLGGSGPITWTKLRDVWAKMKFKSGREPYDRDALQEEATYQFYTLYDEVSDVTVEHRFVVNNIPYNIRSIDNVEMQNKIVHFEADRGVAQ